MRIGVVVFIALHAAQAVGMGVPAVHAPPADPPVFERIDSRAGLSHNTILSLAQDRRGFVWIGTADGLNRFDGLGFAVWRHDPEDESSIWDNAVQALAPDADGSLWIGTARGLNRLAAPRGRMQRVEGTDGLDVYAVASDPRGGAWFDTYHGQLGRVSTEADQPRRDGAGDLRLASAADRSIRFFRPRDESLIVAEYAAGRSVVLHHLGPSGWRTEWLVTAGSTTSSHTYVGPSGTTWIAGDPDSKPPARARLLPAVRDVTLTSAIIETRDGTVWMGSDRGLVRYDPTTESVTLHDLDGSGGPSLGNHVLVLMEDAAGAIWIGTRSGLYRLDGRRKPFHHRASPADAPVTSLLSSSDGDLWIGTAGAGLFLSSRGSPPGDERPVPLGGRTGHHVWALAASPLDPGAVWVGTEESLFRVEGGRQIATSNVMSVTVLTISVDRDGALWAGGSGFVARVDPVTRAVERFDIPIQSTVQAIHAWGGHLWIGTEKRGLWRAGPSGTPTPVDHPLLRASTVWTIVPGEQGTFWLGTSAGLLEFDPAAMSPRAVHGPAGLPGSLVYAILRTDDDRLWLSTNRGLATFDPATSELRPFPTGEDVSEVEFNRRSASRAVDGTLYFGGLSGVTYFDPIAIRSNPVSPPVVITSVVRIGRGDSDREDLGMMPDPSVTLTPRDHTLVITFAALNYTSPAANQYAYRLEGHDPVWIDAGAERVARFVNLPPGRYTFRVRAANNDGVWNEDGAALALTVSPSFWQTIWFRLLLGVLVAGALAGGYRLRVKRLLEVERLRLRIAGDLHDDIGSKLGSIALISEMVAGHEGLDERDVARLQEVARVSRRMAGDLRDIVWLVSPGYDTVGDLAAKLEHVAASILSGVSVSVETPGESAGVQLPMETRRQVFLAYREVLHNVARHARASRVDVRLDQDAGAIVLEVRDDGVGWDQRERTLGHGLRSLRERTQQVGGSVEILSAQGEGTTVRLRVPAA